MKLTKQQKKDKEANQIVREWLLFVYTQSFSQRLKLCWTIMSKKGMSRKSRSK